jgi:hypothetical protein
MSPPQENPLAKALAITSATILMPGSSSCQLESRCWADMSWAIGSGRGRDERCGKDADGDSVQFTYAVKL